CAREGDATAQATWGAMDYW
nr:immunoglobulin heavy chain junction region [Mus musculus]